MCLIAEKMSDIACRRSARREPSDSGAQGKGLRIDEAHGVSRAIAVRKDKSGAQGKHSTHPARVRADALSTSPPSLRQLGKAYWTRFARDKIKY